MALHYKISLYKSECRECNECTSEILHVHARVGQMLSTNININFVYFNIIKRRNNIHVISKFHESDNLTDQRSLFRGQFRNNDRQAINKYR